MNRVKAFLLPVLLLSAAVLTSACVSVRAGAKGGVPANHPQSSSSDPRQAQPATEAVPSPAESLSATGVEDAIRDARAQYELGVQYYGRGEVDEARASFDKAIERLTTGPRGAREDTRLGDAYADLLREIQDVETASYQSGSGLSPEEPIPIDMLDEIEPEISPEEAARERALLQGDNVPTDVPIVVNDKVLAWLGIYQTRLHDRFQEGLTRSGRYIDMMRSVFRDEGLPEDLVYMAHVESAYKPYAYSRARAKGIWQFIAETGSRYGLRRNYWIDERSDPELSTRAAAAYLKDLHELFGDWYLAMAAYNAGEGKIMRAQARLGQVDFWTIARTSQIRLETKNYVPAILAAILISKNPEKFGFSLDKEAPLVWESVAIDSATDLSVAARLAGTTVDDLRTLNPALTRLMTPPNYPDFELRLPQGRGEPFASAFATLPVAERIPWKSHTVRRGETLAAISRRYGVSVSKLRQANALPPGSALKAGMALQIPTYLAPPSGGHGDVLRTSSAERSRQGGKVVVKVRSGDTLTSIARRYRTSVENLKDWNRLRSNTIHAGDRLIVYSRQEAERASGGSPDRSGPLRATQVTAASAIPGAVPSVTVPKGSESPRTYRVRKGDTLYRIATRMSTTVESICSLNNISARAPLMPGTILRLDR